MTDTAVTVVKFRDPRPPHSALCEVIAPAIKYSFKVRKTGTASFYLARSDPNVTSFLNSLVPNEPPMVTIERPDGYLPWVGFVTGYTADMADPHVLFQASDHSWRLASPGGARTTKSAVYSTGSGRIIREVMRDIEERGEPPSYLNLAGVSNGPGVSQILRADYGLDVLENLAKATNFEWGFAYNVTKSSVDAGLLWISRLGVDRRDEEIWSEQKHFTKASYALNYANGIRAALAIGGGAIANFGQRPAVMVSKSGKASESTIAAYQKTPVSPYGLGGTRIGTTQRVLDTVSLKAMATQLHEAPEYAVEQISLTLSEGAIDMSRFALGDIRTVRLQTTALTPIERVVRLIGIQMNPDTQQHEVETQCL